MCISWGYLHPPLSQLPGTSNPECCLLFPFCIHLSGPPSSPCIDFHSLCPKSSGHRSVIFQLPKCCCHRLLFHFGHMGLCLYRLYFTVLLENNFIWPDKWKKHKPYKQKITILSVYSKDTHVYKETWTRMFKAAFLGKEKEKIANISISAH